MAIELPYVMPDKKTVYITDDGTNTMLGLYVAKEAGDLSCGSLYAAKFTQIDAANGVLLPSHHDAASRSRVAWWSPPKKKHLYNQDKSAAELV